MLTASCICIILGAVLIVLGRLWNIKIENDEKYRGRAEGVIEEIVPGEPDDAGIRAGIHDFYYPVITYYANGRLFKVRYKKGSNPCEFYLHQKVELCYNEHNPEEFEICSSGKNHMYATAVYGLGFALCCLGGIFFLLFATRG